MEKQLQSGMFLKNLSMLGGAMLISYFGSGAYSLDELLPKGVKKERSIKRTIEGLIFFTET